MKHDLSKKHQAKQKSSQEETASKSEPEKEQAPSAAKADDVAWKEKFLRVSADLQNFKRRVEKERASWFSDGQAQVISALLPLLDELDLALAAGESFTLSGEIKAWVDGLHIVRKNLAKQLGALGVEEIDCSKGFDPAFHEALMHVESPDHESGSIVEVVRRGYRFKDSVLRHAKVTVAK